MQQTQASLDEWRYQQRLRDAAHYSCSLQRDYPVDLSKPPLATQAFYTGLSVREEVSDPHQLSFNRFRRRLEQYNREEYVPSPTKKQKVLFEKVDHAREQIMSNQDIFRRLQSKLRGRSDHSRMGLVLMNKMRVKTPFVGKQRQNERSERDTVIETNKVNEKNEDIITEPCNDGNEKSVKKLSIDNSGIKEEESITMKSRKEEIAELEEKLQAQHLSRTSRADRLFYTCLVERELNTILEEVLLESIYDIAQDVFEEEEEKSRNKELSPELLELAEHALHQGPMEEVLIHKYNVDITRRHLQCLLPTTWLNDEVINFYFQMMSDRDEALVKARHLTKRSHFFNSFLYTKLSENGYNYINVRRWTRKIDLFAMDKIFLPINVANMHWCMAVIFMTEKRIQYYDSMHGSGASCLKVLLRYLHDESEHKKKQKFDDEGWELVTTTIDTPQQNNGSDCGVFLCMFADYLSLNKPLSFAQKDIPFHRHRMVLHVSRGYIPLEEEGL